MVLLKTRRASANTALNMTPGACGVWHIEIAVHQSGISRCVQERVRLEEERRRKVRTASAVFATEELYKRLTSPIEREESADDGCKNHQKPPFRVSRRRRKRKKPAWRLRPLPRSPHAKFALFVLFSLSPFVALFHINLQKQCLSF